MLPPPGAAILIIVLGAVALACLLALRDRGEGYEDATTAAATTAAATTPNHADAKPKTIFVSVPSYRDASCMRTLRNMFAMATHPGRVFVGCCEQNTASVKEQCKPNKFKYHANVRVISIPHGEAKGPTYARALCADLYRGEDFVLSIDSHSKFAKGWDVALIDMLRACPSPKAIVTHYPPERKAAKDPNVDAHGIPCLCASKFGGDGLPVLEAVMVAATAGAPRPVPYLAGGMWFAPGSVFADVPMDPTLSHLFQGEEFLLSARCWTAGYDMYTPTKSVVFHYYGRKGEPHYWDDQPKTWHALQTATGARVRQILGLEQPGMPDYAYGMGSARTLQAYYDYCGIDPVAKTSRSKDIFCAEIK